MNDKFIRVSPDVHMALRERAESGSCSQQEVIAALLKASGDNVIALPQPKKVRRWYAQRYTLSPRLIGKVRDRVPQPCVKDCREWPLEYVPYDLENVGLSIKPIKGGETTSNWVEGTHRRSNALAWLCGHQHTLRMRSDVCDIARGIKECKLMVAEEDKCVFIPANEEARMVLRIVSVGGDFYENRESFCPSDLFLLWLGGYEINYVETL